MLRRQRRASAYCWQCFCDLKQLGNKTVISRLLGEQSNNCPSVVEKIWETVALCLWPLATVSQIFTTTSGQYFDCSPRSHEITVYLLTSCYARLLVLGGDGTLSEVINALVMKSQGSDYATLTHIHPLEIPIGIMPTGKLMLVPYCYISCYCKRVTWKTYCMHIILTERHFDQISKHLFSNNIVMN